MITFTPLAGSAKSVTTTPLAYVLQVDDVKILLDCGSPDWVQEPSPFEEDSDMQEGTSSTSPPWREYCEAMKEYVF